MKNLVIIQTAVPDYRKKFFNAIENVLGDHFDLYGGDFYFEKSVKSDDTIPKKRIKNHFILNNKFLFQTGIWHLLFKDVVLVLEMNPRILSNWIFLIIRKITNRQTILWGHAWPRAGKESNSEFVRKILKSLGNILIVYTEKQRRELLKQFPKKTILSAPNAVISVSNMVSNYNRNEIKNIIFVGRLTKLKKALILIKAFHSVIDQLPKDCNLLILGSGEEIDLLEQYVSENELNERVFIKGHISSFKELKKYYHSSLFSVSPGYVGLSITQSFSFGVPMLVSKNENHSPEIEAFKDKENGVYFKTDNKEDLANKLLDMFNKKEAWVNQRQIILNSCKRNYSIEKMADTFIKLIN